jgi:hypothetical protein
VQLLYMAGITYLVLKSGLSPRRVRKTDDLPVMASCHGILDVASPTLTQPLGLVNLANLILHELGL